MRVYGNLKALYGYFHMDLYSTAVADPGSEKKEGARGFGGVPQRFFVNFSQFRGLNSCAPPPPPGSAL